MLKIPRLRARAALVLAFMMLVAACGGADTTATTADAGDTTTTAGSEATTTTEAATETTVAPVETTGGELVVGLGAMTEELNPFRATSPPRNFLTNLVYSHLMHINTSDGPPVPEPEVLSDYEQIDDLTWEFTVIPGLSFPNGEALDAEAAAFAINWARNPDVISNMAGSLNMIDNAEAVDETTVRVNLLFPSGSMPLLIGMIPVLPPELFQETGEEDFYINPTSLTGQFQVVEHVPGERLVLEPNPGTIEPPTTLDTLRIVEIPEDAARVAALAAGDVDIINKVPTDQISSVDSSAEIFAAIDPGTYVIDLYRTDGQLEDPLARQAMNIAIDRDLLNEAILGGLGV
ncbi:MAG: ABC transporter substrate-binding protein, partial [Acidimicrobiia bacterium]|nr:ABC transporter substrate-binding protein [Acidimicrobiia bacterium]